MNIASISTFNGAKHAAAKQNPRVKNIASRELGAVTLTMLRPEENGFLKDEPGLDAIVGFWIEEAL